MADLTIDRTLHLHLPVRPTTVPDLWVSNCGYFQAKRQWIHNPFKIHAVGLIASGRGTYQVDGGPVLPLEPGCMFTVYPGPRFDYGAPKGKSWEEYYFCLVGTGVRRLVGAGWLPTDGRVYPLSNPGAIIELYRELLRAARCEQPGDADRAVLIIERILLEMYFNRRSTQSPLPSAKPVEAVLGYCQRNLSEEIQFENLAREHAMSYSLLRQRVREMTGLPPAQYLTSLRCDAARRLLSDTDLPVKQIGTKVGIDDPYTFSRVFKRHVGVSPQNYREQTAPWATH
jgi:AraC-like DNA-binding protein